ncbi:Uncharacterised protein [Streptococcus pneumoniae]|nr:Uncharacterised protein [Streptococcus pneumoniae]
MELVLPNNYVVIEQEEMMYLDGGGFLFRDGLLQQPLI